MHDPVFRAFLEQQRVDALLLADASDILELTPLDPDPCQRYLAEFRCTGLVRDAGGVQRADRFTVGIRLPADYLIRIEPLTIVTVQRPLNAWHPNIFGPVLCPGYIVPGTPLPNLLFDIYEILTYHRVNMNEQHALNRDACAWARQHAQEFPVDRRPLRRPVRATATADAEPRA